MDCGVYRTIPLMKWKNGKTNKQYINELEILSNGLSNGDFKNPLGMLFRMVNHLIVLITRIDKQLNPEDYK